MINVLTAPLKVLDITGGAPALEAKSVRVRYIPEGQGIPGAAELTDWLDREARYTVLEANAAAAGRMNACRPMLREIAPASRCVPGMRDGLILHAGPPVSSFEELGPGLQKAVIGAAIHEGLAFDEEEATKKLAAGTIRLECTEEHRCAAAGCGVVSGSMSMFCVADPATGCRAYAPVTAYGGALLSEGRSDKEAVDAMIHTEGVITPLLQKMIATHGDLDVFSICADGLQCGDDGLMRLEASADRFMREFLPLLCRQAEPEMIPGMVEYLSDSRLYAQLLLAAQRCCMVCAGEETSCTLFANAASNGRKVGLRPSGSTEWLEADLPEGFVCGDELLGELFGMGSAAVAGAPVLLRECRMGEKDALEFMYDAYEASSGHMDGLPLPYAGGKGSPLAPDYSYLVRSGKSVRFLAKREGTCAILDCGADPALEALERYRKAHEENGEDQ